MNKSEETQIMRSAIKHYGKGTQMKKAIEELAELITAIAREDVPNIKEEIADVSIMLDQLCLILDFDLGPIRKEKLERLKARMRSDKK